MLPLTPEEIAKEAHNPLGNLREVILQLDILPDVGPLGKTEWAAGPSLIVGAQPGNWSIFGLFDNVWDFAGSGDQEINAFNLQYQAVYLFQKNWFFITNWNVEADWTAPSNNRWTVPVGGGFGKQFTIGKQVFQAYGQVGYNVVRPDDTSSWRAIAVLDLIF